MSNSLDGYDTRPPQASNALEMFASEWSSKIPGTSYGYADTFGDRHLNWAEQQLGGFVGRRFLELGPLEGGQTHALLRHGAAHVLAIESNRRSFLKCLLVQNHFGMHNATFLLGDFAPYLGTTTDRFDIAIASGVLYHAIDPVAMIRNLCRVAPRIYVWSHYFDRELMPASMLNEFAVEPTMQDGAELWERTYPQVALSWKGFCGGPHLKSRWMSRSSLLAAFECQGRSVSIGFEARDHQNGPAIVFVAT